MAKPRSTLRRVVAVVIGVPVALLALYLLLFVGFFIFGPSAVVDDLIAKRRLDGVTRDQLLALLGPADETDHFRDWDLVYWLGPERNGFMRIDSEWLVIRFDAGGRVGSYRLVRD